MSSVRCPTLGLVRNRKYCNAGAAYQLLTGSLWPEREFTQARTNQSRKWCWFVCWSWIWGSEREKLPKKEATTEVMKRLAGFLGTRSMSHIQELSRTLQTAPASFHVVCKTFLEAWQELSFQGRVKAAFFHLGSTFRAGQSAAGPVSHGQQDTACSHSHHTTAFLPQQPVALGWGGGKGCLGSAPSYSLNLLLTSSQPIFGCWPRSRHCFPTAPFQKGLKEMSSVGFSLVCAKTIS